ncbi:hypothetical protein QVD17_04933 [Tagetes erecta]|uniref:Uncharacterized protein n=1 Tax=Tagetes erecta TaxID=13708 RepID=A0AAD8LGG1_TARER|nr:hypothetical protein QVD17_04933 [Tagetes erecta]
MKFVRLGFDDLYAIIHQPVTNNRIKNILCQNVDEISNRNGPIDIEIWLGVQPGKPMGFFLKNLTDREVKTLDHHCTTRCPQPARLESLDGQSSISFG